MSTKLIDETDRTNTESSLEGLHKKQLADSNSYLGMGATIGVVGAASAVFIGATCPLCVVAAPALIGAGIYKRWQAHKK